MLRRILKGLGWALASVLGLAVAWLVLALTLSRFDQAPLPEVQAAVAEAARPVDWSEANGFAWLAGLDAPEGVRPAEYAKGVVSGQPASPDAKSPIPADAQAKFDALRCKTELEGVRCLDWYGARAAQVQALLPAFALVDQRYAQMLAAPRFDEALPNNEFSFLGWSSLPGASERHIARLMLLAHGGQPRAALDGLQAKIAFERRALAGTRTLIGRMVVSSALGRSLLALTDLAERHPELAAPIAAAAAVAEPLPAEALSLRGPLAFETAFAARMVADALVPNRPARPVAIPGVDTSPRWFDALLPYLVRRQQTINTLARRNLQAVAACEGPASGMRDRFKQIEQSRPAWSWWRWAAWPNNLAGEVIVELAGPGWQGYCERLATLEAVRRLSLAQAQLLQNAQAALPAALNNPFTDQPFERTADGTLRFVVGRTGGSLPETLNIAVVPRMPAAAAPAKR